MARLVIYSSGVVNQAVELTGRDVRIGRAQENDVVLADPAHVVSRFHAELRYEDGHYILLDLNSANGTWVFDHQIQRIVLDSGKVAEIGSYRLALETDTDATTAPPRSRLEGPATFDAPGWPVAGTPDVSPLPAAPEPALPVATLPVASVPPDAPARPVAPVPTSHPEDSVAPASRVPSQPAAGVAATGSGPDGRPIRRARQTRALVFAGVALAVLGVVAVVIIVGGEHLLTRPTEQDPRAGQGSGTPGPVEPSASAAAAPVEPPVVRVSVAADKQEVAVSAVSVPHVPPSAAAPRAAAGPVPRVESTPAPAAEAKLDAVRVVAGVPGRPGERESEYVVRTERLQALYGEARTALQAKDYTSAVQLFERLEREQPGLLDVSARLAESREGLRESKRAVAEAALAAAAAAEQRGDFVESQKEYERALDADPASGAGEGLRRVRAQMKTLGDAAFKRARTLDALSRTEDAIAQYEWAVQLLAPDDPNRKAARQRLDVLRAGIIK